MSTDEQFTTWCRRIKASDQRAYEQVFRALHDSLFRYALSITGGRASARDVVQDAFMQLWERRSTLDPSRSLEAFLYRMVRNRAYNHQRNHRTRTAKHKLLKEEEGLSHKTSDLLPDTSLNAKTLEAKLEEWIEALPDRQREALLLSRFEGLSHQEIAAVMEISPRTVNNHIVQALKRLRDRIRAFEPDLL